MFVFQGLRNSKVFDLVLNVLPVNMSDLIASRLKHRVAREQFNKRLPQTDTYFDRIELERRLELREGFPKTNILMIGIDSVSANHFKRVFPRTHGFLSSNFSNNIIFEHLNSVGTNTYPNIIAMLSGILEEDVDERLKSEIDWYRDWDSTFHDHLPFIWYEYEKLGYVTHFQEDDPSIAIFNYYKNGFR